MQLSAVLNILIVKHNLILFLQMIEKENIFFSKNVHSYRSSLLNEMFWK